MPTAVPKTLSKILEVAGLPPTTNLRWGTPYEEVEALIPSRERVISKTDAIGFNGSAKVNGIPAMTVLLFESRKLSGIRLEFKANYWEDWAGHYVDKSATRLQSSGGEKELADRACGPGYLSELVRRLDDNFSKTKDLACKVKRDTDPGTTMEACRKGRCKRQDTESTCTAEYKHAEASDITLAYEKSASALDWNEPEMRVYWNKGLNCSMSLLFKNTGRPGGI